MSYKNIINSLQSNKYSSLRSLGSELGPFAQRAVQNHLDFPQDLEMQMPRTYSAMSSPLPRSPPRPIPSPGSRWIETTDRRGDSLPDSDKSDSRGLIMSSEHTPLMQHCHHLSINISISVPGSPGSVNISPRMGSPDIPMLSVQQPSRFRDLMAAIPEQLLNIVLSLTTVSRLVLVIVLALIVGLTILGNLGTYIFPLLCLLERILWQNDQAGFCARFK